MVKHVVVSRGTNLKSFPHLTPWGVCVCTNLRTWIADFGENSFASTTLRALRLSLEKETIFLFVHAVSMFRLFECSKNFGHVFFMLFFFFLQDITFHWVSLSEEMSRQHTQNSRNTSCGVGNRRHRPFKFQDVIVSNNLLYHSIFFSEWMEILKLIPDWLFGVCVVLVCHPGSAWNWKFWNKSARAI